MSKDMNKRNLVIIHPGTGTVIPLSDEVYVFDMDVAEAAVTAVSLGEHVWDEVEGWAIDNANLGRRIDNWNMGNMFFGWGE